MLYSLILALVINGQIQYFEMDYNLTKDDCHSTIKVNPNNKMLSCKAAAQGIKFIRNSEGYGKKGDQM